MSRRGEETLVGSRNPVDPGQATERFSGLTRLAAGATIALVLFAIIGFLWGPAASLDALREAAARRDSAEIARRIDGPALRHSLGRLLLQQTGSALPGDGGNDRQLLGQFIVAGALVRPLVETLVAPDGIAALLEGHIAPRPLAPGGPGSGPRTPPKLAWAWDGLSTARATVMTPTGDPALVLVLRRDGFSWRLAGVEASAMTAASLRQTR